MELDDAPIPSPDEVQGQLAPMLASAIFKQREKPSLVFQLLVEKAILGVSLTEKQIRREIFPAPHYDPFKTHVRTAINAVRGMIKRFYEGEGRDDLVVISLPKRPSQKESGKPRGKAYLVVYTYSKSHSDNIAFALGMQFQKRMTPRSLLRAQEIFLGVVDRQPDHFEARSRRAACLCMLAIFVPCRLPKKLLLDEALYVAQGLVDQYPDNWRAHTALAVGRLCRYDLLDATQAFGHALILAEDQVQYDPWLAAGLLAAGHLEAASRTAFALADKRISDPAAWIAYAFYLYFEREFEKSAKILHWSLTLDVTFWLGHLGLTFVYLAMDCPAEALSHYQRMQALLGDARPVMQGLGLLVAHRALKHENLIPSLIQHNAQELSLKPDDNTDWTQMALLAIATGDLALAVKRLVLAWQYSEPLVMLLRFWPVMDPLRALQEFQNLLRDTDVRLPDDDPPDTQPLV